MDHLTEQDAGLLEQAASMLEEHSEEQRTRGNCSAAEGAACSAHAIRRLAPAMLRAGHGCLAQIEEPSREHDLARMEAERNDSLDRYRLAAEVSRAEAKIYEAGFSSGWGRRGEVTAPAAVAGSAPCTFMTEDRACEWAWAKVREEVGTKGWTTGDSCNFYGFYLWGWKYRAQYELQRTATLAALKQELTGAPALEAPAAPADSTLRSALERAHAWMDGQADAQSKGGHATFDMMMLREERDAIAAALAAAPQAPAAPVVDTSEPVLGEWPRVSGVGRDAESPRTLLLYLQKEASDDELRAIHDALLDGGALATHALSELMHIGYRVEGGKLVPPENLSVRASEFFGVTAVAAKAAAAHSDDLAVDRFATEMKSKLAAARAKGRGGWETCQPEVLSRMLREHADKGDPRDVANFCMFLWCLGQPIGAAPAAPVAFPWRTGIPQWTDDRSVRVIAVTAHDDFGGVQVHDIRASDFHTDGDGDGAEVARVCTHWAYRDDIWPRADATAVAAPIPWGNFPAYLIDHCEGQTITEEGLQHALAAMLANPQYAPAAPAAPAVDASDTALLDAMERERIAVIPEFEGPWDAQIFGEDESTLACGSGATPRKAIAEALVSLEARKAHDAAQAKEGGAPVADAAPLDVCTDPYNCARCKTHPAHRGDMHHAGISRIGGSA